MPRKGRSHSPPPSTPPRNSLHPAAVHYHPQSAPKQNDDHNSYGMGVLGAAATGLAVGLLMSRPRETHKCETIPSSPTPEPLPPAKTSPAPKTQPSSPTPPPSNTNTSDGVKHAHPDQAKILLECLSTNESEISKCQSLMDMLRVCRISSTEAPANSSGNGIISLPTT